ncbi:MAG: polysaccharide biosynthesis/export family protein [Mangrovicoccus sp.]
MSQRALKNGMRILAGLALFSLLTACALPRSGPTKEEVFDSSISRNGNTYVILANRGVARAANYTPPLGFTSSFQSAGLVGSDTIRAGDTLGLTIWENVDDGIITVRGTPAPLNQVQVDGSGHIFVPYAGRVMAAGLTPDQLRNEITIRLQSQTPDPQVLVVRAAGDGATVAISGAVNAQGVYPIERPTRRLSAMLARAGGINIESEIAQVTVLRGGQKGTIWFDSMFSSPANDIALRGGDRILVEPDRRAFTALGATGSQTRVTFNSQEMSAMEALAQVGGLLPNNADPTGIFLMREEPPIVARKLLGDPTISSPVQVAYVFNLTSGAGIFTAREFTVRDDDTIFVTEAPYAQFNKALSAFFGSLNTAASVQTLAN